MDFGKIDGKARAKVVPILIINPLGIGSHISVYAHRLGVFPDLFRGAYKSAARYVSMLMLPIKILGLEARTLANRGTTE